MRKFEVYVVLLWGISIILLLLFYNYGKNNNSKEYRVEINRVHHKLTKEFVQEGNFSTNLKFLIKDTLYIRNIDIIQYTQNSQEIEQDFFMGLDVLDGAFVILPLKESNYFVRYEIRQFKDNLKNILILSIFTVSFAYIIIFGLLVYLDLKILKELKKLSKIPAKLAKGQLWNKNLQEKNGYFKDFIWGMDMLREKLNEQKQLNYEMAKDRKTFVAGLSHDIKNPLASIKNYAIAVKDGIYTEKEDVEKAVDVIIEKSDIINELTSNLLNSSIESLNNIKIILTIENSSKLEEVIEKLINQKLKLLHIESSVEYFDIDYLLSIDIDRLTEAFENIIDNAVKYGDNRYIKVRFEKEDNFILVKIINSGKNINKNEIKHIFSSFYRGSNSQDRDGHGLGLYVSKKILKAMNGDIYAENIDDGVVFTIVICMN